MHSATPALLPGQNWNKFVHRNPLGQAKCTGQVSTKMQDQENIKTWKIRCFNQRFYFLAQIIKHAIKTLKMWQFLMGWLGFLPPLSLLCLFLLLFPISARPPNQLKIFSLIEGPQLQQPQPLWHKSNLVQEKSLKVSLKQIKTHNKEKSHRKNQENPQWSVNSYSYVKSDISKSFMLLKSNRWVLCKIDQAQTHCLNSPLTCARHWLKTTLFTGNSAARCLL